ncbi:MAG TPA: oligosaccharide flippase family protein [Flavobacterium sp.]|nr:oligosaccharide flippase family protein [Flavobacterium sp.]
MIKDSSIKNIIIHGAGQMINLLAPFLVMPYVITVCGIDKWGMVGVVTSTYILMGLLIEFGANLIGVKELSTFRNKLVFLKSYIGVNYKFRLLSSLLLSVILISVFLIFKLDISFYWGLTWMIAWYYNPLWIFQAQEDFKKINKIIFLSKAVYVLGVYLLVTTKEDYVYVVGILGLSNSIFYAWYYYQIPKNKVAFKRVPVFFKQNSAIVVSNFAISFYTQAPIIIIKVILGNVAAGIFNVINLFLTVFRSYLGVFFNVTYPRFCYLLSGSVAKAKTYGFKMMKINVFLLLGAAIIIFLTLPYAIGFFDFSQDVQEGLAFSSFLLFLPVIIALNIPYYQLLLFKKQNNDVLKISVGGVIITLALGIPLTYAFGLMGICVMLYVVELYILLSFWRKGTKFMTK